MEPFEEMGVFWIPDNPESQCPGRLSFDHDPGDATLDLIGSLETDVFQPLKAPDPTLPVVFGTLGSGSLVTLTGVQPLNTKLSFFPSTAIQSHLTCRYIFRGAHLSDGEDSIFHGIQIRFEHLDQWAFLGEPVLRTEEHDGRTLFTPGDTPGLECRAFDGILSFVYSTSQRTGDLAASFEISSAIEFEPDRPWPIKVFIEHVSVPLQYLLTFGCGTPLHATSLSVKKDGLGRQLGDAYFPTWIDVGYAGWRSPLKKELPRTLRLPLSALRGRLDDFMQAWQALYVEQRHAMIRLYAIFLGLDLYLDTRFLFAVQAVELYHRRKWPEGVLPVTQHKDRVASIANLIDRKEDRTWLKQKLAFSNEPTLRERLNRMVEYAGTESDRFLRSDLPKKAADTRNYLTHYNPKLVQQAATGQDLWILSTELIALMEFCFLRDLGFDGPEAFSLSARTDVYRTLLQRREAGYS
jgi:hypothetical protein